MPEGKPLAAASWLPSGELSVSDLSDGVSLSLEWAAYDGIRTHRIATSLEPGAQRDVLLADAVASMRSLTADLDGIVALRPKLLVSHRDGPVLDVVGLDPIRVELTEDGFTELSPERVPLDPEFAKHMPEALLADAAVSRRAVPSRVERPTPVEDTFDNSDKDFDLLGLPAQALNLDLGRARPDAQEVTDILAEMNRLDLLETALDALDRATNEPGMSDLGGAQ